VQKEVDEVVGIMQSNIEKVIDRGDKLDQLQDKTGASSPSRLEFFRFSNPFFVYRPASEPGAPVQEGRDKDPQADVVEERQAQPHHRLRRNLHSYRHHRCADHQQ